MKRSILCLVFPRRAAFLLLALIPLLSVSSCGVEEVPAAAVPESTRCTETAAAVALSETEEPLPEPEPLPNAFHIDGVPGLRQYPSWPTGCEAVSAVMLLNYAGYDVSVSAFIWGHLKTDGRFYSRDGLLYGPDPRVSFVGYPWDQNGWGCMPPVIRDAMLSYGVPSEDIVITECMTLAQLAETYILRGIPVAVWVEYRMETVTYSDGWYLPDGTLFRFPTGEHCVVMTGYDEENYFFMDPQTGREAVYPKDQCENSFSSLGSMALAILSKRSEEAFPEGV